MENKKEKRKVSTKTLIAALLVLVLLLASVLGFTLARYFTQGEESQGGINIAQWDIDVTDSTADEGAGTVTAMLSPAMEKYDSATHADTGRTNTVAQAKSQGLVIINNSDVDAEVTLTITDGLKFYKNDGSGVEATPPSYTAGEPATNPEWQNVTLAQIIHPANTGTAGATYDSFSVNVYKADGTPDTVPPGTEGEGNKTYEITLEAKGGKLEVLIGDIVWTSDLSGDAWIDEDNGIRYGDARDTWIGENVGSVGFAYSWSAVQGSQIPEAQQPAP